jgi:glycosyltransferase involved in cell wall biosynthesis
VPYQGYAEFEAALDLLVDDAALRRSLGEHGRAYVEARYRWDDVLHHTEELFATAIHRHRQGLPPLVPSGSVRA